MNQKLVTALKNAGIVLTNENGNYRSFGDVISEIASKWDKLEENGLSDDIAENLLVP